jgi:hypothetical protein
MNLAALNATISVGDQLYIAAYNAFVTIHNIDSDGVTIGGLCQFLRDSQTNIMRRRVNRDILMHMAHPVELGVNMEMYDLSFKEDGSHMVPRVKDVGAMNSDHTRNDFWREWDDRDKGNGLFRRAVSCYDAGPSDPIDDFDIYDHHETWDDGC